MQDNPVPPPGLQAMWQEMAEQQQRKQAEERRVMVLGLVMQLAGDQPLTIDEKIRLANALESWLRSGDWEQFGK